MRRTAIAVLTFKSREHILSVGGTCSWALNRANARKFEFAVCTRNANTREAEGPERHATAFLVGRISDVVPSPERPERWLIQLSEYAIVDIPNVWGKGWRNPVRYTSIEDLGIDPDTLNWQPMPEPDADAIVPAAKDEGDDIDADDDEPAPRPLTIAEAKAGLAETFGVSPDAIEITIRG